MTGRWRTSRSCRTTSRSRWSELRSTLLGEGVAASAAAEATAQVAAAVKGRANDPEAHRLYLQAQHFIDRMNRGETAKGIEYFKQALDRDPTFALARAELSRAYANEANYGWAPLAEAAGRAREAVAHALALEPELAEGHAALDRIHLSGAMVYAARGETDLAFEWLERAHVKRDPGLAEMKFQSVLRPLHADPRWGVFLHKMGLAD
jgi:tetratricopeptide (TPR) repeat protein